MPRGAKVKREIFKCPKCEVQQPIENSVHQTFTCLGCETKFALVKDDEGGKALVEYYNQGARG